MVTMVKTEDGNYQSTHSIEYFVGYTLLAVHFYGNPTEEELGMARACVATNNGSVVVFS